MHLLLGSGGFRTEDRKALLIDQMQQHFGHIQTILFIPYALADHDAYVRLMVERGFDAGYELVGIHTLGDPIAAVESAQAIYIGGGNTFRLVNELYRHGLIEPIRRRVRAGVPYMGVSAGANVACPTLCTTNDMPIVMPPSFETLGLVPFQINPHYFAGQVYYAQDDALQPHFGETRDDRIREYHELNALPVLGLYEGGLLRIHAGQTHLLGAPARLFRPSQPPIDLTPPATLTDLLPPSP